jgi:sugar transferase (PEP-CTERM system associated)
MLFQRVTGRSVLLIVCEHLLIVGAVVLAAHIRLGGPGARYALLVDHMLAKAVLVAFICQLCLYYAELYDLHVVAVRRDLFVRTLQALGVTSLILAGMYFWLPELIIGRGVSLIGATIIITAVVGWRLVFDWTTRRARPRERLLLVGTTAGSIDFARELHTRRHALGVEIVGFVDVDVARVGEPVINPGIVGTIADIPKIVDDRHVDRVVVNLADARGKLPMDQLLTMRLHGVRFDHLADVYEEYTGKIAVENLRPSWLIFSAGFRKSRLLAAAKRVVDIIAATSLLTLTAPLMALVTLVIKLTSPGPVLFHQRRVGEAGRVFTIHKLRSMRLDAEAATGAVWASRNDPRVTPVGRFLRMSRLDELPQLWNVLKGDMSLVGPRPERPEFVDELTRRIPFYGQRHVVKPGVTGWAQVRYSYGASTEDAMRKLQYDLFYIKHLSIAFDLYIIVETVRTVLFRRGT